MKNYIIAGFLLLFLSAASLFLPSYVMEWQDEQRTEKSQVEEVQEVVLKEQVSMTLSEKLKLREQEAVNALNLVNGKNYNQDTIDEQVRKEIGILAEQGLLLDFDMEPLKVAEAVIYFYVDMEDSERSIMMWEVSAETLKYHLVLTMDDETGKILSFSQYGYDWDGVFGEAVEQYDAQSSSISISKSSSDSYIGTEELQEMAERWGDYLGCEVTESHITWLGERFVSDTEEFAMRVENMIVKGYTREEAEMKVASEYGLDISERLLYAGLEDESGQIGYALWPGKYLFRIEPILE